ncbi:type II secretion system F family protein [Candidatus Woesearchaeota archaeon]|nr:type II secretion system F family protein [Candidatus Woesearchaeota archaeon]
MKKTKIHGNIESRLDRLKSRTERRHHRIGRLHKPKVDKKLLESAKVPGHDAKEGQNAKEGHGAKGGHKAQSPEKPSPKVDRKAVRARKRQERHLRLKNYMLKAGIDKEPKRIRAVLFNMAFFLDIASFIIFITYSGLYQGIAVNLGYVLFILFFFMVLMLPLALMLVWIIYLLYLDIRAFRRKLEVENVLPDFLQLASSNMKAGMPIDKALWFAVRPQFGVLAKEIELVAKQTLTGEDLTDALHDFALKYDSNILQRSIDLIIEGIESGGNVSELLLRIADGINKMRLLKKEMAASVATYVIFITFASIMIAPVMFALSYQLISIVQSIISSGDFTFIPNAPMVFYKTIDLSDFRVFSAVYLAITSLFSAMIISTIRKGTVKEGINFLPVYILVALVIYFVAMSLLKLFLSGIFV